MTYMIFSASGVMDTRRFTDSAVAVAAAKMKATNDRIDYQIFKLIETHYIKAPVMPEPTVEVRDGVVE